MQKIIIKLIKLYQGSISHFFMGSSLMFFNSSCRFCPTCSDYAIDAVSRYGVRKGVLKAVGRILRCNPLVNPGVDEA